MAKLFCIVQMTGGNPNIDPSVTPYIGYVLADQLGGYGAYLISGSDAQLIAINALAQVVGITAVSDVGEVHWAELDNNITSPVRTKINTFLTSKGITNIPAGWTYRQVVKAIFQRFNNRFDLNALNITE